MSEEIIIVFSPKGINPDDYKKRYLELDQIPEFKQIKARELVFCWFLSNPTSHLVYEYPDREERIDKACEKTWNDSNSAKSFARNFKERKLPNQTQLEEACRRMEKILPTVRYRAQEMLNNIFKSIEDLLNKPQSEFTNKAGDPDLNSYMAVRKMALKELPEMVKLAEVGFGIEAKETSKISGQANISNFLKNKKT